MHRRDFAERRIRAQVGDRISFTAGRGPRGRTCARNAANLNDRGRFGFFAFLALVGLLVLPAVAILKFLVHLHPEIVAAVGILVNVVTYLAYSGDKRRARGKEWRISESTLHLLELIGGWPAAFIAQRVFRHKIRKARYQVVFWTIVLMYQAVAFDLVQGGQVSKALFRRLLM